MEISRIYTDDFKSENQHDLHALQNISLFCNSVNHKLEIYGKDPPLSTLNNLLTFPNVVYIEELDAYQTADLFIVFPDLVKVGEFSPSLNLKNLGHIQEIDVFHFLRYFLNVTELETKYDGKLRCEDLGNNLYKFISNEATSVVKINGYD